MNIYIAPITNATKRKSEPTRSKEKASKDQNLFQEVLQNASITSTAHKNQDGFSKSVSSSVHPSQTDVSILQRRIYQVNEELMGLLR